ncbi:hypothetical protein FJT64_022017 [Amphibalanus amphitrite]|uniref:Uncharacterized protein n=1 Tax=Amphibalanus amphitrite TaxID=1232801 RepID=A0A6A4WMK9_AMPAM|nr:hypothetical protein FJT64_022017 [Amphibalanus amphitrite]
MRKVCPISIVGRSDGAGGDSPIVTGRHRPSVAVVPRPHQSRPLQQSQIGDTGRGASRTSGADDLNQSKDRPRHGIHWTWRRVE